MSHGLCPFSFREYVKTFFAPCMCLLWYLLWRTVWALQLPLPACSVSGVCIEAGFWEGCCARWAVAEGLTWCRQGPWPPWGACGGGSPKSCLVGQLWAVVKGGRAHRAPATLGSPQVTRRSRCILGQWGIWWVLTTIIWVVRIFRHFLSKLFWNNI